jgi:hypothetical protein|tara:strand:- start:1963 stop:2169 length:207 start_codon:yes stop_codon:yes gene_type:complete
MEKMTPLMFFTHDGWQDRHETILSRIKGIDYILQQQPKTRSDLIQRYHLITERLSLRKLVLDKKGKSK